MFTEIKGPSFEPIEPSLDLPLNDLNLGYALRDSPGKPPQKVQLPLHCMILSKINVDA